MEVATRQLGRAGGACVQHALVVGSHRWCPPSRRLHADGYYESTAEPEFLQVSFPMHTCSTLTVTQALHGNHLGAPPRAEPEPELPAAARHWPAATKLRGRAFLPAGSWQWPRLHKQTFQGQSLQATPKKFKGTCKLFSHPPTVSQYLLSP